VSGPSVLRLFGRPIAHALSGLLAGAAGLSFAHLLAQFIDPNSSPVIAVGDAAIDAAPTAVKEWAIREFGSNDKHVLLLGIAAVLAVLTMIIGIVAAIRFSIGVLMVTVLGIVAIVAELGRPNATAGYPIPTVIGLAAAVGLLWSLLRALPHRATPDVATDPDEGSPEASRAAVPANRLVTGSRREFLVTGAGVSAAGLAAFGISSVVTRSKVAAVARSKLVLPAPVAVPTPLPSSVDLNIAGLAPFITPNADFYRVDTALVVPHVNPDKWKLTVDGMVDRPFSLSLQDIFAMPLTEHDVTVTCVSNEVGGPYVSNARWLGVALKTVLDKAGLNPEADQLFCTATDGFTTSTPIKLALDGRDAMIAVGMNGQPLPLEHGFPARMIVPGLYGYVSACKWLTSIEVTSYANKQAYWTQRGWDINGPIYTEARIDVPNAGSQIKPGTVAVAGVAWAQHRGIAKVEVSIDGGDWQPAMLASTPGIDTWRQWWLKWDATSGQHQIRARATDATGQLQTANQQDVFPRGATGYPQTTVTVS
jgi:DMSO/TMAO reductase YedYZ molybdopterin-dependent catalytic subunit